MFLARWRLWNKREGLTVTRVWQASLLEKEVMLNQERNQREKFDGGHHDSNSSSPFANVGYTPTPHGSPAIPAVLSISSRNVR